MAASEGAFYTYAYPEPEGYREATVTPSEARYDTDLGEFVLPYEVVRVATDPEAVLTGFLETTYAAAADLGGWDRRTLERPLPEWTHDGVARYGTGRGEHSRLTEGSRLVSRSAVASASIAAGSGDAPGGDDPLRQGTR